MCVLCRRYADIDRWMEKQKRSTARLHVGEREYACVVMALRGKRGRKEWKRYWEERE